MVSDRIMIQALSYTLDSKDKWINLYRMASSSRWTCFQYILTNIWIFYCLCLTPGPKHYSRKIQKRYFLSYERPSGSSIIKGSPETLLIASHQRIIVE